MSYERGWKAINLEMQPEIPRTEYISNLRYIRLVSGLDPEDPDQAQEAWRRAYRAMDFDFIWLTFGRPLEPGRRSWMGTAQFAENPAEPPRPHFDAYQSVREVLETDPLEEYRLPDLEETATQFQTMLDNQRRQCPDAVVPGGIYNTVFTWCILAYGWEMFLEAAVTDPVRFDEILEQYTLISERDIAAWLRTDMPLFLCHDDIVWTQGPVFHPDWYRKHIIPRYERLWAPIKERDLKVLFCSDGNYEPLVDDLVAVGADGFIFEPLVSLERLAENYGQSHVLIGNMDCRILMRGPREAIRAEVERCWRVAQKCAGYFYAVGNHIPYNVPVENVAYYMEEIAAHRLR